MAECTCKYYPTIILPGIGQSKVELIDKNGNKIKNAWPLEIDSNALLGKLKGPLMKMMMFRKDMGFSDAVAELVKNAADPLFTNADGTMKNTLRTVEYPGSVAECTEDEKRYIYKMVPMRELSAEIGEDHLFFFAYNSFGNASDTADKLDAFIQNVKAKTGHDKVNLVPVSLGGALAVEYFIKYGAKCDVARVVNFIAALDGSALIADVVSGNLKLDDIGSLLGMLAGSKAASMGDMIKMVPAGIPELTAKKVLNVIVDNIIKNSTMMWGVVPHGDYEALSAKYLSDAKQAKIRQQADEHYRARADFANFVAQLTAGGTEFFNIVGYGKQLLGFAGSDKLSSDTIINVQSPSMGATAAPLGEKLSAQGKYVSPDGTIDASTCLFPDRTWFFANQVHDDTAYNDVALKITRLLLTDSNFDSIDSLPGFPQFNNSRNVKKLVHDLLPRASAMATKSEDLKKAVAAAEAFLDNTIVPVNCDTKSYEAALSTALGE